MKVRKAIIPAAGLGTRFLPATKAQPKEMLPIVDKPTIQYIIEEAVASGIEEILIITGRNKKSIEDHFDKSFVGNEPFAVMLGDDVVDSEVPCLKQLINCFNEYKTTILGVQTVDPKNVDKYGIVDGIHIEDRVYKVKRLVEKPSVDEAPSNVAILGRYIITPQIFEILENTAPGKGNEIQLTDALETLIKNEAMYAYDFEGQRYDVGDKLGFLQATVEFAMKREELREPFIEYLNTKPWER